MAARRRGFGAIRRLPSKRYQASYVGPDLARHLAPTTFTAQVDAEGWLAGERRRIESGDWTPPLRLGEVDPAAEAARFGPYASAWLVERTLKPRTRAHYRSLIERQLLPTFNNVRLDDITPALVRTWHAGLGDATPTLRAHAYSLLRTILKTATDERLIDSNPCVLRGAGSAKRVHRIKPATLDELETIASALPQRYRLMPLLAAWTALRFGELIELRRRDVDLAAGVIRVRRGATRADGQLIIGTPKSDAGVRDVSIPPHLIPAVREHLSSSIAGGRDGLLFPAADGTSTLAQSTFYRHWYIAREAAQRPDLRFHDLRHSGAVMAAATGATLAELMARLGHSTPGAAMRYQHAAQERDREIAAALSRLAGHVE